MIIRHRLVHFRRERVYELNDAPNPKMSWRTVPSSTTISAWPIGPGVPKLIGFGLRFVYVSSDERSHVVAHCETRA